jgi:hypothetical protein
MTDMCEITTWLTVEVQRSSDSTYEHLLAREEPGNRSSYLPRLRIVIAQAHEDARRRLQRLITGSLDPLGTNTGPSVADDYPQRLHIQTLKGYFGEILAGVVAEELAPFGNDDWEVPAHLFRFHLVEFQQLAMIRQTGAPASVRPGRTGDDCLAFRRNSDEQIIAVLFCEAKCTADHDSNAITEAHQKASLSNLLPVDLLQIIEVLEDSTDPTAARWVEALRRLHLQGPSDTYERLDQITYVHGRRPIQSGRTTWIPSDRPHSEYSGSRRLHVAEVYCSDVEGLVRAAYGVG